MRDVPMITLNDGVEIPQMGFCTFQIEQSVAREATLQALNAGYRHIDTAEMYGNEKGVGAAVRDFDADRSDIFVTSKLNNGFHAYDDALAAFDRTMGDLGLDYIDLFLIHWPLPEVGDYAETWKAMEAIAQSGRCRSIGVSNFQPHHLERLFDETDVVPSINRIEVHPYFAQNEVRACNAKHGIATEAWSPSAQGRVLDDPALIAVGEDHGKSSAQVALRWHIQRGDIIFPKSSTPTRMAENIDIFDFELTGEQMASIDALDRGTAHRPEARRLQVGSVAACERLVFGSNSEPSTLVAHRNSRHVASSRRAQARREMPENTFEDTVDVGLEQQLAALAAEVDQANRRARANKLERRFEEERSTQPYQAELIKLQRHLEEHSKRMIVLFEGRDASGKGGTIRRVTRYMNVKHYRVVALGKPTEEQRTQWYLQRYVEQFPRGGEMVLFDRSWYNRSMVEPIFGFCTEKEYRDFLRGVVGFEKDLVRQGTILVKLYFSVSKKEQQRRFERRRDDPLRQWKLSEIDVQAQEHWDDFTEKKYEMLRRTHTPATPWTIIRSENKQRARINTMRVILDAVDYDGRNPELDYVPESKIVVSGAHEVEIMEADRVRKGRFRQ